MPTFQIANVNTESLYYAGSIVVPSVGWVIYGSASGLGVKAAFLLKALDSTWQSGPSLHENQTDTFSCIIQVIRRQL